MNNSFIKNILWISSASLLSQGSMAAHASNPDSNVPTSKNIEIRKLEERIAILEYKQKQQVKNAPIDPVLALPQVNFRPKYNTASVYNQDLAMLKMRQKYDYQIKEREITPLPYPHIELGGSIIGVGSYSKPPMAPPINGRPQSDVNLAGANFDVNTEIMEALMGNIRISYNPNGPERINTETITTRLVNSNIFLNTAFLTLGDLSKSPFYLSGGQMFLPFGEYGSSLLTAPLPARLGRMKQRPILLGFEPRFLPGFNASVFTFRGDSYTQQNSGVIDNGGGNISYSRSFPWFSITTAGSYIDNLADAGGMQNTGPSTIVSDAGNEVDNSFLDEEDLEEDDDDEPTPTTRTFRGFGAQGHENLVHRVSAFDARARLKLKKIPLSFYGEILRPTRSFDASNVSFNNNFQEDDELIGAAPSAWNAEGTWSFTLFNNPSSITLGYGHSSEALTFNLPQSTRGITFRTNFKRVVTCALGYQYDNAYPAGSWATGQTLKTKSDTFVGTTTKTLTGQIIAKF